MLSCEIERRHLASPVLLAALLSAQAAWATPGVVARCDFDGDGYDDLVAGTPSESG